jgi:hypothetical protein
VGTTAVAIKGVVANFKVLTANFILMTVPAGASSGKISFTAAVLPPARNRSRCSCQPPNFWGCF